MPAVLALVLLLAAPDLDSKEVADRLEAVRLLGEKGGPDAEAQLLKALEDDDWEVIHRAVEALATRGRGASVKPLAELAVTGPLRRIRLAAARSLKAVDAEEGAMLVTKRLRGTTLFEATEALAVLGTTRDARQVERMLRNKEADRRAAAVRALGAEKELSRIEVWKEMLLDPDLRVQVEAIHALALTADEFALRALLDGLKGARLPQVLQRRYILGVRDLCVAIADDRKRARAGELCARAFGTAPTAAANARFARLLGSLGRKEAPVGPVSLYVERLLSTGTAHSAPEVRRATAAALARIGNDAAWEKLHALATGDSEWLVRFHALRAAVKLRGKESINLVLDRTRYDESKFVREEAATIAGRLGRPVAVKTLVAALADKDWEVVVCASVSLGKLHAAEGVEPLLALLGHKDWRVRGGAAAGLGRIRSKKAVPVLLDLLRDKTPAVASTAREALLRIAGKSMKDKELKEWWKEAAATFAFRDPDKEAREAKKYGYAVTRRGVYENLDVIVLVTRKGGDNIQFLLTEYGIEHREIRAASVSKIGLSPYAVFVANCPGEIVDDDVEQLRWFVRAGGYLFASCWALTHTVQRAFPEVVDKLPQKGQVIGTVEAQDVDPQSPYMKDVFDADTSPLYELMGSHLIRVLDPERFEVLIDSPQAASIWGDGNLAGWFTVGHGTILDSANHFDLQGMQNARVKTEEDRMAFAADRLGYDYTELRELKKKGVFRKAPLAIKSTRDLSTFRFITCFVRQKRLADEE